MGAFFSASHTYVDVFKMNTFMQIDFQQDMGRQFEMAKAAGAQQSLAQIANVGGLGGRGGGWSSLTPWGDIGNTWIGINNFVQAIALPMIFIFSIVILAAYFSANIGLFFAGIFLVIFFVLSWFSYHSATGVRYITTRKPLLTAFGGATIGAIVLTFAWFRQAVL